MIKLIIQTHWIYLKEAFYKLEKQVQLNVCNCETYLTLIQLLNFSIWIQWQFDDAE